MRLKLKTNYEKAQVGWKSWFAWHPVWVGPTLVWLETVERKWTQTFVCEPYYFEYRLKETQNESST